MALPGHGPGQADLHAQHDPEAGPPRHPVGAARKAVLTALSADLPSPILTDVTGMHRHTALRWVAYARRDWAAHLAVRAEDLKEPSGGDRR